MKKKNFCDDNGFTLVELLVVTAIMGLVVLGIYGLFLSMSRSTYQQDEVVEVQQNLRTAMNYIGRDIRMAGFMIPLSATPIQTASRNILTLNNATISGRMAKIDAGFYSLNTAQSITVKSPEMVDLFDHTREDLKYVRIIRPASRNQPQAALYTVTDKDRANRTLVLSGFSTSPPIQFSAGDVIVNVPAGSDYPLTIQYNLNAGNLQRITLDNQVVASYLASLEFEYLRADGTVIQADPVPTNQLDDIRAVRVTMTAETDPAKSVITGGVKSRTLTQVFRIRNQR
jgi:prepilin-type N-terminal cleavage/methylation domain-containing protein